MWLETARLRLRPLTLADEGLYCALWGDAEVMQFVVDPLGRERALASLRSACRFNEEAIFQRRFWIGEDKQAHCDIGLFDLNGSDGEGGAQIGSLLARDWQNRGYAVEALAEVMRYGFEALGLAWLWGQHPAANARSASVMSRLGFKLAPRTDEEPMYWVLHQEEWARFRGRGVSTYNAAIERQRYPAGEAG